LVRWALFVMLAASCGFRSVSNGDGDLAVAGAQDLAGADLTGVPCSTLKGQEQIGPQPLAVAAFAGGVAAASIDALYIVDPASDTVLWSKAAPSQSTWLPLEAWAMQTPSGAPVIAVAYGPSSNPSSIREIDA
jgi:hypothetical protein